MFRRERREAEPEGFELLPAAGSPFGPRPAADGGWPEADPDDEPPETRRGRIVAAAAVAVAAAVIVGVTVAPSGDDSSVAGPTTSAPTTPATASTASAPTTDRAPVRTVAEEVRPPATRPDRDAPIGMVLAEAPSGLTRVWATDWAATPSASYSPFGDLQLWATPDASRTSGAWMLVQTGPYGQLGETGRVRRVAVGEGVGLLKVHDDGVTELSYELSADTVAPPSAPQNGGPTTSLAISSFGLTDAQLAATAASVVVDADGVATIGAVPDGMRNRLHTTELTDLGVSVVAPPSTRGGAMTMYTAPEHDAAHLTISVSYPPAGFAQLLPFLVGDVGNAWVSGRAFMIGSVPGGRFADVPAGGLRVAVSSDATGRVVVISTTLDEVHLGAALAGLRVPNRDVWGEMVARSQEQMDDPGPPVWREPRFQTAIHGPPVGEHQWAVRAAVENGGVVAVETATAGFSYSIDAESPVGVVALPEMTIVVASTSERPEMRGWNSMRVRMADRTLGESSAVELFTGEITVAAIAFDDLGPFTVELLDDDGTVIDTHEV